MAAAFAERKGILQKSSSWKLKLSQAGAIFREERVPDAVLPPSPAGPSEAPPLPPRHGSPWASTSVNPLTRTGSQHRAVEEIAHLRDSQAYNKLLEMGFEGEVIERSLEAAAVRANTEAARAKTTRRNSRDTNTHTIGDIKGSTIVTSNINRRDSSVVNDSLDLLLEWGCEADVREILIFFVVEDLDSPEDVENSENFQEGELDGRKKSSGAEGGAVIRPRFPLLVRYNFTIAYVKHRIQKHIEEENAKRIYVALEGKALDDTDTLGGIEITPACTLLVLLSDAPPPKDILMRHEKKIAAKKHTNNLQNPGATVAPPAVLSRTGSLKEARQRKGS